MLSGHVSAAVQLALSSAVLAVALMLMFSCCGCVKQKKTKKGVPAKKKPVKAKPLEKPVRPKAVSATSVATTPQEGAGQAAAKNAGQPQPTTKPIQVQAKQPATKTIQAKQSTRPRPAHVKSPGPTSAEQATQRFGTSGSGSGGDEDTSGSGHVSTAEDISDRVAEPQWEVPEDKTRRPVDDPSYQTLKQLKLRDVFKDQKTQATSKTKSSSASKKKKPKTASTCQSPESRSAVQK